MSEVYLVFFIYLFCFQASKYFFFSSQYCDPHKRGSLGGLYMQSLTDNIYICENVLKAQKDAEKESGIPTIHIYMKQKQECLLTAPRLFPHSTTSLRSFLFICSTSVQCNSSHVYKCQRCMWSNSIQRFHVFVGVLDMYTLK